MGIEKRSDFNVNPELLGFWTLFMVQYSEN
jgi:hypothetical protein